MSNLLDNIGAYLVTQGIGTLGTDLFLGWLPDTPNTCTVVVEGVGDDTLETFGSDSTTNIERPALQIVCRGEPDDYDTPRIAAEAAKDALQDVSHSSLSSILYYRIRMRQPPFPLGRDENGRFMITFNCDVWKEPN